MENADVELENDMDMNEGIYIDGKFAFSESSKQNSLGQAWVYASGGWQGSGIYVTAGQIFTIAQFVYCIPPRCPNGPPIHNAYWKVNPSHKYYGASGHKGLAPAGYVLPGEREGCLVFKIGPNGQPKRHGSDLTADSSGELYFIANDDIGARNGAGFADNVGRIDIRVYS